MTAQVHEKLILDGEATTMMSTPLLPVNHPGIATLSNEEMGISSIGFCSSCWREYLGTWEVKNGKFYLVSVEGRYVLKNKALLAADWFTGEIEIPRGEQLQYVHMGYESVYEEDLFIGIEKGIVTGKRIQNNRDSNLQNAVEKPVFPVGQ